LVFTQTHRQPKLDPKDLAAVHRVLASCPDLDPQKPPSYRRFLWLMFRHEVFQGRGLQLLRYLGYQSVTSGYFAFLARMFPDGAANRIFLRQQRYRTWEETGEPILVRHELEFWHRDNSEQLDPEGALDIKREQCGIRDLFRHLLPIESRILRWRCGLDGEDELTLKEIGEKYDLSRERIRSLQEQALGKLRKLLPDPTSCQADRINCISLRSNALREEATGAPNPSLEEQIKAYGVHKYIKLVESVEYYMRIEVKINLLAGCCGLPDIQALADIRSKWNRNEFIQRMTQHSSELRQGKRKPEAQELDFYILQVRNLWQI